MNGGYLWGQLRKALRSWSEKANRPDNHMLAI